MTRHRRPSAPGLRGLARQARLERILRSAEELFSTKGFRDTAVDEIAAAAGVSKGLLYDHYASKEALLAAIWERLVAEWWAAAAVVKVADGALAEALGEAMLVSLRHVQSTPLLRRIIAQDPSQLMPGGREGIARFGRGYRELVEALLRRGVANGELRRDLDVPGTAEVIWLMHFTITRELFVDAGARGRGNWESLARAAIALVVEGIRAARGRRR